MEKIKGIPRIAKRADKEDNNNMKKTTTKWQRNRQRDCKITRLKW